MGTLYKAVKQKPLVATTCKILQDFESCYNNIIPIQHYTRTIELLVIPKVSGRFFNLNKTSIFRYIVSKVKFFQGLRLKLAVSELA